MMINEAFTLINGADISRNKGIENWADLGCGNGIFTQALARMLPFGSTICGVDKNELLKPGITHNGVEIITRQLDFVNDNLGLQNLDGIMMANALHYVKDKPAFIQKMKTWLKPDGFFLMVEYDTDLPVARWVPYPAQFFITGDIIQKRRIFTNREIGRTALDLRKGKYVFGIDFKIILLTIQQKTNFSVCT